ncbi:hypothetical protein RJ641_013221 [Dillenia turbinata]|uniref:HhH-GPD domain-containing protein n=1 Tax=Dillenia turbinata TaxID=194707 RepID=A0AAN8ZQ97_9MAGN
MDDKESMELEMEVEEGFELDKAVCSSGMFMMSPSHWDPLSKSLTRPLRLHLDSSDSLLVRISQPNQSSLCLNVYATHSLSLSQIQSLQSQVRRMLRVSKAEEKRLREFHDIHEDSRLRGFGRLFRSPTLFEDMVKSILLCNCQWPRTLNMARALCELQLELNGGTVKADNKLFTPRTPAKKESKKNIRTCKTSINLLSKLEKENGKKCTNDFESKWSKRHLSSSKQDNLHNAIRSSQTLNVSSNAGSPLLSALQSSEEILPQCGVRNFPSPRELAYLDESFLAKSCNLGYRAGRILKPAQSVLEGRISLSQLEEDSDGTSIANYSKLAEHLREIDGFGPFRCAIVLTCMGFYHVIPTDSQTIRHLKQIHSKTSAIKIVQEDVKEIYGKYATFQFLAYWGKANCKHVTVLWKKRKPKENQLRYSSILLGQHQNDCDNKVPFSNNRKQIIGARQC